MPAISALARSAEPLRLRRSRAGGTAPGPPSPPAQPELIIRYSTSSDRSNPLTLDAATVSGTIYVHLLNNEAEIGRVLFFVDPTVNDAALQAYALAGGDPADDSFVRGDGTVPFDLAGGTTTANPWDTATDPTGNGRSGFDTDDDHTLKVAVLYTDDTTDVYEATLTVDNSPGAVVYPQVPTGLSSSTPVDFSATWDWDDTATSVGGFDDTTEYEYRYSTVDPPAGASISAVTPSTITVSPLTGGVTYYLQVRGVDADGDRSAWSSAVSAAVTGTSDFSAVTSWMQFGAAGNGIDPNPNALIYGTVKGQAYQGGGGTNDEMQFPFRGDWSSPHKFTGWYPNACDNLISKPSGTSDLVDRWASALSQPWLRKIAHPDNGGFGSELPSSSYGAFGTINFSNARRKHNGKWWVNTQSGWQASNINNANKEDLGYTPGLPNGTTYAEDAAIALAIAVSGGRDDEMAAVGDALVDNTSGGLSYGEWVDRVVLRMSWECNAPWSADYHGINPNLIGSTVLQTAAAGGYGLSLTQTARDLLDAIATAGDPSYQVFDPNTNFDDYPGWREVTVGTADADAGTGGDLSLLSAAAYNRCFDTLATAIDDRCAFRGVPTRLPLTVANLAHGGAAPADDDATADGGPADAGWEGSGSAPDGGDLYKPREQSRQINLRYLDTVTAARMCAIDMDFYCRAGGKDPDEQDHTIAVWDGMILRYLRPAASSEFGFNRPDASVPAVAAWAEKFYNHTTGFWATRPCAWVVPYMPGNKGNRRYRPDKNLDNVGAPGANMWAKFVELFPGRSTNNSDFWGN